MMNLPCSADPVTEVFAVNKNKNQRKRGAKDLTLFHEKDQQVLWKEQ
jgi:hypothetical protein